MLELVSFLSRSSHTHQCIAVTLPDPVLGHGHSFQHGDLTTCPTSHSNHMVVGEAKEEEDRGSSPAFKFFPHQSNTFVQLNSGFSPLKAEEVSMNKSLVVHYFK
jgi:hypothetical protein